MLMKRLGLLVLLLMLLCSTSVALTPEAAELCLERGISSRLFPDGTSIDDLIVQTYTIDALGEPYTVWVVSTQEQRSDVEFGWLSIHGPSNAVLQSSRTRSTYEDAIRMLEWEAIHGCSYFWSSDLKAQYYYTLHGDEARITYPRENEITQEQAIAIARQTLMEQAGLQEDLLDQLVISVEFYRDDTPGDSVQSKRFWGITFREKNLSLRFQPLYAVVMDGESGIPEYAIDYQKDLIIEHTK